MLGDLPRGQVLINATGVCSELDGAPQQVRTLTIYLQQLNSILFTLITIDETLTVSPNSDKPNMLKS